uniref:mRNA export factor MEX67 n=1 Tax=Blastobotrys adeninivorans TaxID=409370 RepID=A0A060T4E9_BLAAD
MSFRGGHRRGGTSPFGGGNAPFGSNSGGNTNDLVEVQIRNWKGGTKDDVINFIRRKSSINLQKVWIADPVLHASVKRHEGPLMAKLSGIKFAGAHLDVQVQDTGASSDTPNTIEALTNFLKSRYNPQIQMLDLTNMKGDPSLNAIGVFATASTSAKMFPALMTVASRQQGLQVESVNLAQNNLQEVTGITTLAQTFPGLKNLSLADNNIARVSGLDSWRHKFRQLRELILTGNPITATPTYKEDVMRLFPRLVMLDGVVVRDESQLDKLALPVKVKHTFFENPDVQGMSTGFLSSYFDLFDRDRSQLLQLYDDASVFSLSVNSSAPRVIAPGSQGPQAWSAYIPLSRNMQKVTTANARMNRLSVGGAQISRAFQRIPPTKHNLVSNPQQFCIDVWRTQGVRVPNDTGVVISIHGEYSEQTDRATAPRSFDRTFIVIPGPQGSMIVASDMLTVRPWSGSDGWKESNNTPGPSAPASTTNTPPPGAPGAPGAAAANNAMGHVPPELQGLNPDQLMMVQNLMAATRLNPRYARMCCEQANFNPAQAQALFDQSRANLPPDAFTM